jgi:hypothetical protein
LLKVKQENKEDIRVGFISHHTGDVVLAVEMHPFLLNDVEIVYSVSCSETRSAQADANVDRD